MENNSNIHSGYNQPLFPEDDHLDVKRYLSLFLSNWYWFAIALFIAFTLAYGINRYSEELYSVSSTLLIQGGQYTGNSSGIESIIPGGDIFMRAQNLNNEIGILKSYNLNYRVVDELPEFNIIYGTIGRRGIAETKLYRDCPFIVTGDSLTIQPWDRIYVRILSADSCNIEIDEGHKINENLKFGQRFSNQGYDFIIKLRDTSNLQQYKNLFLTRYYFSFANKEALAETYRNKLNIEPISEGATMVRMEISGFVKLKEIEYLNKLMELYIKYGLEFKNATAKSTIKFIDEQLGIISDSLTMSENHLKEFKLSNRIMDLTSEGMLVKNRLEQRENEKTNIGLQLKYLKYLEDYVASKNETGDIVSPSVLGISDQELGRFVADLASSQKRRNQLTFNITGEIPAVGLVSKDIEIARATLVEHIGNVRKTLEISLDNINNLIAESDRELMKLPETERQMINIQRKYNLNNTVYTYLLEKRAEAGIAMASTVSENRIIDRSSTLNVALIRPRKNQNNLLALLLGLFVPGLGIILIDYLNNKIIDRKDIEKATNTPILGYISHNEDKSEISVVSKPGSTLAESFRSIRTSLKYYIKDSEPLLISVTSTISSEGKTFTAINLASILAMLGKKVLLVGLDLRKPRIHKVLNFQNNDEGLSTFLNGQCKYEDVIVKTQVENLFYATSGPVPPNPAELLDSENLGVFFQRAKREFEFIIIDTPPIAVVTDAMLLSKYVDLNIFIVRQRYSSKNTLTLIDELYRSSKFKNLAIIVNDISLSGYYGYGLRYGYSMGYGYTYGYNYYGKYSSRYGYSDKGHGYYSE